MLQGRVRLTLEWRVQARVICGPNSQAKGQERNPEAQVRDRHVRLRKDGSVPSPTLWDTEATPRLQPALGD